MYISTVVLSQSLERATYVFKYYVLESFSVAAEKYMGYMDPSTMYWFAFCSFYVEVKSLSTVLSNHMRKGNVAFLFMNDMLSFMKQEKCLYLYIALISVKGWKQEP